MAEEVFGFFFFFFSFVSLLQQKQTVQRNIYKQNKGINK